MPEGLPLFAYLTHPTETLHRNDILTEKDHDPATSSLFLLYTGHRGSDAFLYQVMGFEIALFIHLEHKLIRAVMKDREHVGDKT